MYDIERINNELEQKYHENCRDEFNYVKPYYSYFQKSSKKDNLAKIYLTSIFSIQKTEKPEPIFSIPFLKSKNQRQEDWFIIDAQYTRNGLAMRMKGILAKNECDELLTKGYYWGR